ncbi:MAG: uroporphyrinogen-III synthase [Acidimicrobiales bacterium]
MTAPEDEPHGPLVGLRVVVCRPASDAGGLVRRLRLAGATPLTVPLTAPAPPDDGGAALRAALADPGRYRWLALTSANGVRAVAAALAGRPLPELRVAAVGAATAREAEAVGLTVDLVPPTATAAALAVAFPAPDPVAGDATDPVAATDPHPGAGTGTVTGADDADRRPPRVLAPLAQLASDDLVDGLEARGWIVDRVTAYRIDDVEPDADVVAAVAAADAVILTAPSIVDRFLDRYGLPGPSVATVCIGPRTAARATQRGLVRPVVAAEASDAGLVDALVAWAADRPLGAASGADGGRTDGEVDAGGPASASPPSGGPS